MSLEQRDAWISRPSLSKSVSVLIGGDASGLDCELHYDYYDTTPLPCRCPLASVMTKSTAGKRASSSSSVDNGKLSILISKWSDLGARDAAGDVTSIARP